MALVSYHAAGSKMSGTHLPLKPFCSFYKRIHHLVVVHTWRRQKFLHLCYFPLDVFLARAKSSAKVFVWYSSERMLHHQRRIGCGHRLVLGAYDIWYSSEPRVLIYKNVVAFYVLEDLKLAFIMRKCDCEEARLLRRMIVNVLKRLRFIGPSNRLFFTPALNLQIHCPLGSVFNLLHTTFFTIDSSLATPPTSDGLL